MEEIKDDDNVKEINNTDDVEIGRLIEDSTNFWLSVGSPISPDVRPRSRGRAKILSQF